MTWCEACAGAGEHETGCILSTPEGDLRDVTFGRIDRSEDLAERFRAARSSTRDRMREALSDLAPSPERERRIAAARALLNADIVPQRRARN